MTVDWSGSYNGFSWGPGLTTHITEADGLDSAPTIRHNVTNKSWDTGAFFDASFFGARVVTLNFVVANADPAQVEATIVAALSAFQPQAAELPLTMRAGSRIINCVPTNGPDFTRTLESLDRAITAAKVELTATDPRIYGATQSQVTGLLTLSGGMGFPLGFPFGFGSGAGSGVVNVNNAGTFNTGLKITVQGPAANPVITNTVTGERMAIGLTMLSTDTIQIDTMRKTLLLNGGPRRDLLSSDSTYFMIPAGSTVPVRFQADAYQSAALMTLTYAPAYLSIGG